MYICSRFYMYVVQNWPLVFARLDLPTDQKMTDLIWLEVESGVNYKIEKDPSSFLPLIFLQLSLLLKPFPFPFISSLSSSAVEEQGQENKLRSTMYIFIYTTRFREFESIPICDHCSRRNGIYYIIIEVFSNMIQ